MGRNSSGVKGIKLTAGDRVVGMVVADPDATLLTACANGYGKRTVFGPGEVAAETGEDETADSPAESQTEAAPQAEAEAEETSSSNRYRTQRRGGKGVRDIKATARNGPVIGIARVTDDDEIIMMSQRGKIQRIAASDISVIGRNTQGVRIMSLDEDDQLAAVVRVPKDEDAPEEDSNNEDKPNGE
jgi:DNA gyrase subunit A